MISLRAMVLGLMVLVLGSCSKTLIFTPVNNLPAASKLALSQGFRQEGRIRVKYQSEGFTGSYLLEAQGSKVRMQLYHSLGGLLVEVFWDQNQVRHWIPSEQRVLVGDSFHLQGAKLRLSGAEMRSLMTGLTATGEPLEHQAGLGWQASILSRKNLDAFSWPQKIRLEGEGLEVLLVVQSATWGEFENLAPSPLPKGVRFSDSFGAQNPPALLNDEL